jgi:Ni,Fe-hydrogenase III small subunit
VEVIGWGRAGRWRARRWRLLLAVAAVLLAAAAGAPAPVRADSPEGGGSPGTSITVTPDDNLPATQAVSVTGSGFLPNRADGTIQQCGDPGTGAEECSDAVDFSTNGSGAINGPVSFTARRFFDPPGPAPTVDCALVDCVIHAAVDQTNARHHLTFALPGELRVTTSPPLPSQILVNGVPRDSWGLTWVDLAPGTYTVSFTHVEGWTEPAPQQVTVTAGATTTVNGVFTQRGSLRVTTNPAVPSTISVGGVPRNEWGMWTDLPTGSHQVCFGPVAGFAPPPCQTVNVTAGNLTTVTGNFTASAGAPGPSGTGDLRVTTSPPLPSQILVDGVPRDSWGLTWVDLAPGTYTVSFTHVEGWTEPAPQQVTVTAGATTTVNGVFTQRGSLRVTTNPAVPSTISVGGVPRNEWGMWTDLPTGSHQVCFAPVGGFAMPPCQTVNVTAGALTTVTGNF